MAKRRESETGSRVVDSRGLGEGFKSIWITSQGRHRPAWLLYFSSLEFILSLMPLAFYFSYLGFLQFARLDIVHESMRPLSEPFSEQWVCPQKFQILYKILLDAG
jgi:hypothetical protein